ncbi:pyridoxamine 5'-phosphate oxidase [Salinisphaera sp. T31B1]
MGDTLGLFVNSRTGKGRQLEWNPHAGLCFFWRSLQTQVVIDGTVELLDEASADHLWSRRSRECSLVASASHPERVTAGSVTLPERISQRRHRYDFQPVPRPLYWVAYRLIPIRMEFWATGWQRARLRRLFERAPDGGWQHVLREP